MNKLIYKEEIYYDEYFDVIEIKNIDFINDKIIINRTLIDFIYFRIKVNIDDFKKNFKLDLNRKNIYISEKSINKIIEFVRDLNE